MTAFTLALAQYPIEQLASFDDWRAKIAFWVGEAVDAPTIASPSRATTSIASGWWTK